jgi:hypothetical protein
MYSKALIKMSHTLYRIKGMLNNAFEHLLSILKKKIKDKNNIKKISF